MSDFLWSALGTLVGISVLNWMKRRSATGDGALSRGGYLAARVFKFMAWPGVGLAVADAAVFAVKPDLMWHGFCLCYLSIGLLFAGIFLVVPANVLKARLRRAPALDDRAHGWLPPQALLWLVVGAVVVEIVSIGYGMTRPGDAPDWTWWAATTAPVFPLWWHAAVTASAAVRQLAPMDQARPREAADSGARPGLVSAR